MNYKVFTIMLATIVGCVFTVTGGYNLVEGILNHTPLFEGAAIMGIGIVTLLSVVIAMSLGKTISMFNQILKNQADMQQKINQQMAQNSNQGLSSLFGMIPKNFTVIDNRGEDPSEFSASTAGEAVRKVNEMLFGKFPGAKDLNDMSIKELEEELAKMLKKEDYERADLISKIITEKKGGEESNK